MARRSESWETMRRTSCSGKTIARAGSIRAESGDFLGLQRVACRSKRIAAREFLIETAGVNPSTPHTRRSFLRYTSAAALCLASNRARAASPAKPDGRFLYVAVPGIRNYLEFGGHGVLVFDIEHGHKFVRRIPAKGLA